MIRSWQSIGAAIPAHATDSMTESNGFLPVGEYTAPKDEFKDTIADCAANDLLLKHEVFNIAGFKFNPYITKLTVTA